MFDLAGLEAAVARHARVARLVIADIEGSCPRETGASMLVWQLPDGRFGQSGTIGGGTLEYEASHRALARLQSDALAPPLLERISLGPQLGQCCGGALRLLTEVYDQPAVQQLAAQKLILRPVAAGASRETMPLAVKRVETRMRAKGILPVPQLLHGWMIEPILVPEREIWIWGAGHVGRALVSVLSPMPEFAITWIDTQEARFPTDIPPSVRKLVAEEPQELVRHAPKGAEHLVLTYSHALDLELCHRVLAQGFGALGLIGSATKWARFASRLGKLGHSKDAIGRICCPIGDVTLGKNPQAIAVGVAVQLMKRKHESQPEIADDSRDYVRR